MKLLIVGATCLMIGVIIGYAICAILTASSNADRCSECYLYRKQFESNKEEKEC